jgi:predicted DsbA family dithiol-disulfide isomerase
MAILRHIRMTVNRLRQRIANPNASYKNQSKKSTDDMSAEFPSQRAQLQAMNHSIESLQKACVNRIDLEPVLYFTQDKI